MTLNNLRDLIDLLREEGDLVEVAAAVDPYLEIAEIHRRVIATGGPALLFANVKGSPYPVVTNLFGTARRIELGFGRRPVEFVRRAAQAVQDLLPPSPGKLWGYRDFVRQGLSVGLSRRRRGPVLEVLESPARLDTLPVLTSWPDDGGPFITLPLVYTEHPGPRPGSTGTTWGCTASTSTTGNRRGCTGRSRRAGDSTTPPRRGRGSPSR